MTFECRVIVFFDNFLFIECAICGIVIHNNLIFVRGVPTTAIYENGVLVERVVGYEDVARLKKRIDIYHKPLRLPAEKKK
jgi:hypothetical protein